MKFLNRSQELERLDKLATLPSGGLAVVYGRRRVGKTRLLLEWVRRRDGLYTVSDLSAPDVQRRYFAAAIATRLTGFADVDYPDWAALLTRLAREAGRARWRGPLVIDELPYLVSTSPELPSVLQRFIDHEAKTANLVVALAGSSQRMMQGLVLSSDAPLYGRAREIIDVRPIEAPYLRQVFPGATETALVEHYAAWGGIPWYWELASESPGTPRQRIDRLVLDPLAPLHMEPDRLLLEETPSALEVRPVLDAIGAGAHRVSEIGARLGRPATSLSRPIARLVEMGLVRREIPFGEPARTSKKSLYRIDDPFFRLWFRVVAANRAVLASAPSRSRLALLDKYYSHLVGAAWEDLCRTRLPSLRPSTRAGRRGPWTTPSRWWSGSAPEWDIVSESADGHTILLGEAKWTHQPLELSAIARARHQLEQRPPPELGAKYAGHTFVRVLFVPAVRGVVPAGDVLVVTARELF